MEVHIATPEEMPRLSDLSISLGNIAFLTGQSIVAVLKREEEILGFAAVQNALHAAGSWVKETERRKGYSYALRSALDDELRRRGYGVYFAMPGNKFEQQLFRKYGPVEDRLIQVRTL